MLDHILWATNEENLTYFYVYRTKMVVNMEMKLYVCDSINVGLSDRRENNLFLMSSIYFTK